MFKKHINRKNRHFRIRKKIVGTADAPRVAVKRSNTHLHVQVIDDISEKTIASVSTSSPEIKAKCTYGGNVSAAQALGEVLANKIKEKSIERIRFDRAGYQYHGRIKALADSLRSNGIKF